MTLRHFNGMPLLNLLWLMTSVILFSVVFGLSTEGPPIHAEELAGVHLPEEVQLDGLTLVLMGLGLRGEAVSKQDYYVGGLYLESKLSDADEMIASLEYKKIVIHFLRNVERGKLRDAWQESFDKNCGKDCKDVVDRFQDFKTLLPEAKKGDVFVLDLPPGEIRLIGNGEMIGEIHGDDFARFLLKVWLGPYPPNEGLKRGILGLKK